MNNEEILYYILDCIPKIKSSENERGLDYSDFSRFSEIVENTEEVKLEVFLSDLSKVQLVNILKIIYYGRGDGPISSSESILKDTNKEIIISTIISKVSNLEIYINNAFEYASANGINLNDI